MSELIGANLDDLANLSARFAGAARSIESARGQVERMMSAAWAGADADEFRSSWQGSYRGKLQAVIDGLNEASRVVDQQRREQAGASDVKGSAGLAVTAGTGLGFTSVVGGATLQGSSLSLQGGAPAAKGDPTRAPSPSVGNASTAYASGPQHFSNAKIAEAAEKELAEHPEAMRTGWDQPGECMVSAQRWVKAAGGRVNPNGTVAGSYAGVSTQIPIAAAQRGDVVQYVDPRDPNGGWDHVHTVVVVGHNADGSLQIIERNFDFKGGIRRVPSWQPHPAAGWEARVYRFGDQP